jgi:hypothetical protein
MVACNLDLKPAYKVTPVGQERHHTNETFAWYHSKTKFDVRRDNSTPKHVTLKNRTS